MTTDGQSAAKKSKVELIKENSRNLRGTLAEELLQDTPKFAGDSTQLLKFHGVYQQEDRDIRKAARDGSGDRSYIMMVRTKIPAGILKPEQYLAFDRISDEFANGTLRITTRQTIQFHGIIKGNLKQTIASLNAALVTTIGACGDIERNVVTCPAPDGDAIHEAVRQMAFTLSDGLLPQTRAYHEIWLDGEKAISTEEEPIYGNNYLPRKFKTGVALPGDNCVDVHSNDLGLIAITGPNGVEGANMVVGGGLGMTHGIQATYPRLADAMAFVPSEKLLDVAKAIIAVYREYGDRSNRKHARIKYIVEERGIAWLRAEVEKRLGYALEAPREVPITAVEDHLGWHESADGTWYLGVHVPSGRVADRGDERARSGFRALVERFSPGVVLTTQQNIIFSGFTVAQRAEVDALLAAYGVAGVDSLSTVKRFGMACPAMPTCGLAVSEAERVMPELVGDIESRWVAHGLADDPIVVRMTGCPNGCARPYVAEVGVVGRSGDTYNVYVGGSALGTRLNTLVAEIVPLREIAGMLDPLFATYAEKRGEGETFGDFWDRMGIDEARRITNWSPARADAG